MKRSESNSEMDITGCCRRLNPKHNKSNFKYKYEDEEINNDNKTKSTKKRDMSNNSHLRESLVPNEMSTTYLGSSNINTLLCDKV